MITAILTTAFITGILVGMFVWLIKEETPRYKITGEQEINLPAIGEELWYIQHGEAISGMVTFIELEISTPYGCDCKVWFGSVKHNSNRVFRTKEELINSLR